MRHPLDRPRDPRQLASVLSRKQWISAKEIDDLAELDAAFVSVQESFIDTTTSAGRAMAGVFPSFAQMDRDGIVEKTVRGQRAKGAAGLWPGGHPPFGWCLEGSKRDARPVPDERERTVPAEAYKLLVGQRLNAFQVAARLNDAGLGPRHADAWNHESLRRVLANETLPPRSGRRWRRSTATWPGFGSVARVIVRWRCRHRTRARPLHDLAALADRARGNLDRLSEDQRPRVYEIPRVRVRMTGPIAADSHRVAHSEGLTVSGVLDPRLRGDEGRDGRSENGNGGGSCAAPRAEQLREVGRWGQAPSATGKVRRRRRRRSGRRRRPE